MPAGRWFRELGWRHAVLVVAVLFAIFPVAWILSAAFNAVDNLSAARLIPNVFTWDNFIELFDTPTTPVGTWLWNTWLIAIVAATMNVLLVALAAYAFSRLKFRGRRVGLLSLLLIQVFPQFLAFIALFILAQQMGAVFPAAGLDTHLFLIMVYMGGAIGFNTFLLKGFMDTIPNSLDESARVDGAGPAQIFFRIVFPLSRPILAVIFIITFIALFGEYLLARFLLQSTEQFTVAVGLLLFVESDYSAKWGNLAAASLVAALPIVATVLLMQKQIIGGLTQGAVKG